jgi:drug/metabolite transporter (DMT)-like permease
MGAVMRQISQADRPEASRLETSRPDANWPDTNRPEANRLAARSEATPGGIQASSWAMLGLLSLLWGGSFLFNEIALPEAPPLIIIAMRSALAAVTLIAVARAAGHRLPRQPHVWVAFLIMGALNNLLPMVLIVNAQTRITGGLAAILMATTPLCTAITACILTRDPRERLSARRWAGIGIGAIGVAVLIGPSALKGIGLDVLAEVAVLAASVSYGFANVFGRRFVELPPLVSAAGQISATALMAVPAALVLYPPWMLQPFSASVWGALLGLGLLSTALGYVVFFHILARTGAVASSLVTLIIPVCATVLGSLVVGDPIVPRQLFGMALIAGGLVAVDARLGVLLRRGPAARTS